MSPIPEFFDRYHLPDGEHECTIEEIENRFLSTDARKVVWQRFQMLIQRIIDLKLVPDILLIDGSFVTGREEPGDVDSAVLLTQDVITNALAAADPHDKDGIMLLLDPTNERAIRGLFGAHFFVFPDTDGLDIASNLFRNGGNFGSLRDPDPNRDPSWVIKPPAKGILKVIGGEIQNVCN